MEDRQVRDMTCSCCAERGTGDRIDFQYAAKIVCGVVPEGKEHPLPRGRYFTKINIHNFSRCDCVTFRWKVAVGLPRLRVGPISDFSEATLCADEALEIDTGDIMRRLAGAASEHVEGWVVIESPAELDVVAVYGSAQAVDGPVVTFNTERVCPRRLAVCDNFHADISTGVGPWEVKVPGSSVFVPTTLSLPLGPWAAPPTGSLWVIPGAVQSPGDYVFRLPFKLCSGFQNPRLELGLLADYFANVFINGHQIPPVQTAGPNFSSPLSFTASTHFKAGDNELTVVVSNLEKSPVGLALHGTLDVEKGLCAGQAVPRLPCPEICYEVYTRHFFWQTDGGWWSGIACNGGEAGTTGQHRRAQAIRAYLTGNIVAGTALEYRVHMQGSGWTGWTAAGQVCGITNQPKRLEAVEFRLVLAPICCSVGYQVHMKNDIFSGTGGWGNWAYDGQMAGTTGQNRRVEAMRVQVSCV